MDDGDTLQFIPNWSRDIQAKLFGVEYHSSTHSAKLACCLPRSRGAVKLQDAAWASMARYAQIYFAFGFELISGCCALRDAVPLPNVLWPTSPFMEFVVYSLRSWAGAGGMAQ